MQLNKYGGYADCKVPKRVYGLWYQMLRRCYDAEQQKRTQGKSYSDCEVCARWLTLSYFAEDISHLDGYQNWLNNRGYCLDKDTKIPGNKLYTPYACCFIPRTDGDCVSKTAANLIESLSAELEQVKRERDAAKQDLIPSCSICVHNRGLKKWDDECIDCYDKSKWQWRGVNGKGATE